MLVDASVARSFAVLGWTRRLVTLTGGVILLAEGVHGARADEPSELRGIRRALQRQAEAAGLGSGEAGRALAAVQGLDEMLALGPAELTVVALTVEEWRLAVRLQSRRPEDREWRRSLGARARRLDAGESAWIAIAAGRSHAFASDDEDALMLWRAVSGTPGLRTRDLLRQSVDRGLAPGDEARAAYWLLQTDDLHNLCGPAW